MNDEIIITQLDYIRLNKLISSNKGKKTVEGGNLKFLFQEIERAIKVDSKSIMPEYVTMNSIVKVQNEDTNKLLTLKIVYPAEADFKKGFISVFSPLGSALLGYKAGDQISFKAPKGIVSCTIQSIEYQPEANGDYLQ
jgi:regulator of nucleoside diphosphate kinase